MFKWTVHNIDTGERQVLTKDPLGWQELVLTYERDQFWHGISYDFTTELGFFCKGAGKEFVDAAYDSKEQEAQVSIRLDVKVNGSWFKIFTGRLNFSTYRQEYVSNKLYTFLDAEKDDIKKVVNNREDMEVDLLSSTSLGGVALSSYPYLGYSINMHSKVIRLESEWQASDHRSCFRLPLTGPKQLYSIPSASLTLGNFEKSVAQSASSAGGVLFQGFTPKAIAVLNTNDNVLFTEPNIVSVNWNFSGSLTLTTHNLSSEESACAESNCGLQSESAKLYDTVNIVLRMLYGSPSSTAVTEALDCGGTPINQIDDLKFIDLVTIPQFAGTSNPLVKSFSGSNNRDIILNPNDRVWFYWIIDINWLENNGGDLVLEFEYTNAMLNLTSDSIAAPTTCTAIGLHEAWSRLFSILTDKENSFYSEFFGRTNSNIVYNSDGCGSRVALTSGKNIRQLPSNPPIKPSLAKLFNSCDAIWGIGIGVETINGNEVFRVEELTHFYSDTLVYRMDFVPNIQITHVSDKVYNEVKLGFKRWETNSINGLDEPLTRINYVIPRVKSNKNKFEKLSDVVAGMYAIEITRRTADTKGKDTPYDEELFFLALSNDDLTICEKNENMTFVANLLSPETAYNLRFLLSSTFDRLKNQFVAGLTKLGTLTDPVLMPSQGEGNQTVFYSYAPNGCAGDHFGSVQLNGGAGKYPDAQARRDAPIWQPREYSFSYPVSLTDYLKIIANPYGLIAFSHSDSSHFYGWIKKMEYSLLHKTASFVIIGKG